MGVREIARLSIATLVLGTVQAASVWGDVSFTEHAKIRGEAVPASFSMTRTVALSGKMAREEITTETPSTVPGERSPVRATQTRICRLDKDLLVYFSPTDTARREVSFAQERERIRKEVEQTPPAVEEAIPESGVEVVVKETGTQKKVGGWQAREIVITARTEVVDTETGQKQWADVVYTLWISKDVPGGDEILAFQKEIAQRLGRLSEIPQVQGLSMAFANSLAKVAKAAYEVEGFPVESILKMRTALSGKEKEELAQEAREQATGFEEEKIEMPPPEELENEGKGSEGRHSAEEPKLENLPETETFGTSSQPDLHEEGMRVLVEISTQLRESKVGDLGKGIFAVP